MENSNNPPPEVTVREAIALTPDHPAVIAHRQRQRDVTDRAVLRQLIAELIRQQGLVQATRTLSDLIASLYYDDQPQVRPGVLE